MFRLLLALTVMAASPAGAHTLSFAGYTWHVRDEGRGAPGPNRWDPANAWVDREGRLHLRLSRRGGDWYAAEVVMDRPLGFGTYEFQLVGRPDRFDPNVVLGLFSYTRPGVGPDGTNEIDIELTRWGEPDGQAGHWSVHPALPGAPAATHPFPVRLSGDHSTHRFRRTRERVEFQMLHGHQSGDGNEAVRWTFAPADPSRHVPAQPLPVHLNLWLFKGQAPTDGREVEVIISGFRFTPER